MTLDSLPQVPQSHIKAMEKKAQELMAKDGIENVPVEVAPIEQKHPMLQHQEEPVVQDDPEEQEHEEEQVVAASAPQETPQQMNFRMIRERAERAERERDEAMKYAMSFNQQKSQQKVADLEDDYSDIGLDDDSLAEGKHLKKVLKEMREMKKELQSYKTQAISDTVEIKLKTQFPDFDKVITTENLQSLSNINPDLADMISQTPDLYKRAKLAYDMVKQLGIYKDRSYEQEKIVAQKNAVKPRPLTSISPQQGDTPLSKANAFVNGPLSKDLKDQMYREMLASMKGR